MPGQVAECFRGPFLGRLMPAVRAELKQLSASGALMSTQLTRLDGEEEGFANAGGGRGGGGRADEGEGTGGDAARRRSEKVRVHMPVLRVQCPSCQTVMRVIASFSGRAFSWLPS